jgi:diguanylate cyclase (GGDEF)-like protein
MRDHQGRRRPPWHSTLVQLRARLRPSAAVALLSAGMVVAALRLYLAVVRHLTPVHAPVRLPVWAVAMLTLAAESSVIRFAAFRRDARGYSLGELALITGLYLADPLVLVTGRLLGLAVVDLVQQRQHSLVKVAFNLAKTLLESCVAVAVFYALLQFGQPLGPAGWVAAFITAIMADLLSKLLIDTAIKISGAPRPAQRWHEDLGIGMTVAFGTTSAALIGVTLLWLYPQAAWLLLVPAIILFAAYRAYARQRPRHDNLAFLYKMSRTLQDTGPVETLLIRLLGQARDAFQAELVMVLLLPASPGGTGTQITLRPGAQHHLTEVLDAATALWCWERELADRRATMVTQRTANPALRDQLAHLAVKNAMVAKLYGEQGMFGALIVANRLGSTVFHAEELQVLETIASHTSAALDNARLVERLERQALHDPLTGLANRSMLYDRLTNALAHMQTSGVGVALLFMDLDGFKAVNDRLGHRAGDQLLVFVGQRLKSVLRASDLLVRFAGDEFIILCEHIDDPALPAQIAQRAQQALAESFRLDEGEVQVGASIGIALARDGEEPEALVRRADLAMYEAKHRSKRQQANQEPISAPSRSL